MEIRPKNVRKRKKSNDTDADACQQRPAAYLSEELWFEASSEITP